MMRESRAVMQGIPRITEVTSDDKYIRNSNSSKYRRVPDNDLA